jgi:hypothetical protein
LLIRGCILFCRIGIIVVGVFILLLSFVGYFSAWKEFRIGLGLVC